MIEKIRYRLIFYRKNTLNNQGTALVQIEALLHTSRHTFATLLLADGVSITTIQKLLGHTSVKTTQIYSEVLDDTLTNDLQKAMKRRVKMTEKEKEVEYV